jgi:two-component system NtrC family sensor kinase
VGQTIASLSHHIKNILQGVRGGSYLIELGLGDHDKTTHSDDPDEEKAEKAVDTIRKGWGIVERNQERISTLVMDMLTFSKEREPEPEPANLNDIGAEIVELMQARADEIKVQLSWKPAENMPIMTFDPEALHRALLNVVTNAIDACDDVENGQVTVSSEYDESEKLARLIVADNGLGITPDDLETIFDIFVSRKGGRGTGLGLPVSRKIMEEHGGQILLESEPGQGSTFTLELPANPHRADEKPDEPASRAVASSEVPVDAQPDLSSHGG